MTTELDTHAVTELVLFVENDYEIYSRWLVPTLKNYERKIRAGKFDRSLAVAGMARNVCAAAGRHYWAQFGGSGRWNQTFPLAVREAAAGELVDGLLAELEAGNSYL